MNVNSGVFLQSEDVSIIQQLNANAITFIGDFFFCSWLESQQYSYSDCLFEAEDGYQSRI